MAKKRSYRLLCPIARALDRVGDRWTLVILRDLHAGPARFSDLQVGLPGLASNLLSTRLEKLQEDGLIIRRRAQHGAVVYELTPDGERTAPLLFELATFGSRYSAPEELRRPGNLRMVVIALKESLRRVVGEEIVQAELVISGEHFSIDIEGGRVEVLYAPNPDAALSLTVDYEDLVAVADGQMPLEQFATSQVKLERGSRAAAGVLLDLMARAFCAGPMGQAHDSIQ